MKTRQLTDALMRVEMWPPEAQNELAGIDLGLRAAADGRFESDEQVAVVFAKFRTANDKMR